MKLLTLTTVFVILMSGMAMAAVASDQESSSDLALTTLKVMERRTDTTVDSGMYSYYQDGDDLILRKRPGRAKYGDITLKKGARCGPDDCDDGSGPAFPEAARLNKAELIESIASESGLSKADAKRSLDAFADSEVKALKKGDELMLVGVGSFYQEYCPKIQGSKEKANKSACRSSLSDYLDLDSDGDGLPDGTERRGNPQTGKEIQIPAKNVVKSPVTGEIILGEDRNMVRIDTPGRKIVREVGNR